MRLARVEEIENSISAIMCELLHNRMKRVLSNYEKKGEEISREMLRVMHGLAGNQPGKLVICYLRSSFVTQKHEFYISFYKDEPFVEESPDALIYSYEHLFDGVDMDIEEIEIEVKRRFIQVFSGEIEEIRRDYMERLYQGCDELFRCIIQNTGKDRYNEVYYGEFMGEIKLIGKV